MNVSPVFGDIGGAGTASGRQSSGSTAEGTESPAFDGIVRQQVMLADGARTLSALSPLKQERRTVAQEVPPPRKKVRDLVKDETPAQNGVAGGTPISAVTEAEERLTSAADKQWSWAVSEEGHQASASEPRVLPKGEHRNQGSSTSEPAPRDGTDSPKADANRAFPIAESAGTNARAVRADGRQGADVVRQPSVPPHQPAPQIQAAVATGASAAASTMQPRSQTSSTQALRALMGTAPGVGPGRNVAHGPRAGQTPPQRMLTEEPVEAQVARGLAQVLRQRGGSVTLRLNPDALGEVRVQLEIRGDEVSATMHTSSDAARETLAKAAHSLRASLESHGLQVTELRVTGPELTHAHSQTSAQSDGAGIDDPRARQDGAHQRKELPESATRAGAPYAEGDDPETIGSDFGWAMIGGRLVIDTLA